MGLLTTVLMFLESGMKMIDRAIETVNIKAIECEKQDKEGFRIFTFVLYDRKNSV